MSWRDQLQPGSYNGVPLAFEADAGAFGRRVQLHEYPLRDTPYPEDLGRKARTYQLECFLVGDDYMARRDQLIAQLEQPGPGTLVHPYYGTLRVVLAEPGRVRHSSREGGMCTLTLSFVEAGERQFPAVRADTVNQLGAAADSANAALGADLDGALVTGGLPGFVLAAAQTQLAGGISHLRQLNGRINTTLGPIASISASLDAMGNTLVELLASPTALVGEVASVVGALFGTATRVEDVLNGYRSIRDYATRAPSVSASTPTRQQQASNQAALARVFSAAAAVEAARAVTTLSADFAITSNAQSPFDSLDQAEAVRDELLADLDAAALQGSDGLYIALVDVQRKLTAHIKAHGQTLARVAYITLAESTPSLVLAHRLYGDATQEADLVRRNRVRMPAFVPAGRPLEYLT